MPTADFCWSFDLIPCHADVYVVVFHRINKQRADVSGILTDLLAQLGEA